MDQDTFEIIQKVHYLFKEKGLTLAAAESCTGGLVSHYLTALPGASEFFEAGLVTYSNEAKMKLLGVSPETISGHGVISEQVAKEMAEKARALAGTDYGFSTTGNLGPSTLEGKERGLVYLAVSGKGRTLSRELRFAGDRKENKEKAALSALKLLIEAVSSAS
ncbi:MAG TPA: CinA family protein [Dissulfurispiraceae bacterium]